MKKFALRGLIILAIVVALCIFFSGTVRTLTTPKVRFAQAKMGKFEQSTSLTGKVVFPAEEEIHVAVPEGMHLTVTRVKATAGDKVKAGDLLAAAKVTDADKTLESLRKDYETARSSLRSLLRKWSPEAPTSLLWHGLCALRAPTEEQTLPSGTK